MASEQINYSAAQPTSLVVPESKAFLIAERFWGKLSDPLKIR